MLDTQKPFGRYIIVAEVARGGMGVVYRARDTTVGRTVALKVMLGAEEEDRARFQREVKATAQLSHPNIVPVHDVGVQDGRDYYTMDFIEGPSLAKVIKEMGKLPPRAAARIARDVARALDAAHEKGIVHRDIKPANILLSKDATIAEEPHDTDSSIRLGGGMTEHFRVMLTDFGLAKELDATRKLTISGALLGTPCYMSPEQASGDPIDARSDTYSLAAVLYEMIMGKTPFAAENVNALLLKVVHNDPESIPPGIHIDLRTIVAKGMSKEKSRRYADIKEFADDLDHYLAGEAISARPASLGYRARKWAGRHRAITSVIVTGAIGALAAAVYFFGPGWLEVEGKRRLVWPTGSRIEKFSATGYEPQEEEVQTFPWRTVKWVPTKVTDRGVVRVVTDPAGAEVTLVLRGQVVARGRGDGEDIQVRKGVYDIHLNHPDYQEYTSAIEVLPGQITGFHRVLVHDTGWLSVSSDPEGVQMRVRRISTDVDFEERVVGLPMEALELPTGRYHLIFEKPNHFARRREVTVAKGGRPSPRRDLAVGGTWRREADVSYVHASLNAMELWSFKTGGEVRGGCALGDLDLDGVPDIVVGSTDSRVYAISGRDGTRLWEYTTGMMITSSPALADLNADGVPDAVVGSYDAKVHAISGRDGSRLWEFETEGSISSSPALADLDSDGVPDCVVGSTDGSVYALRGGDGTRLWTFPAGTSVDGSPALADLNADGSPEVFAATRDGKVFALDARGGRKIWEFKTGGRLLSPALGDLNGDGVVDCVVGSLNEAIYAISGRDGTQIWRIPAEVSQRTPVLRDLNGDGTPDCLIGVQDFRLQVRSGRDGSLLCGVGDGTGVALGDLDGDGRPECVSGSTDSRVVARSLPNGTSIWEFRTGDMILAPPALADLDGDGSLDCVVGSSDSRIYAISGRDAGRVWGFRTGGPTLTPQLTGDLDGDGMPECVVPSQDDRIRTLRGADGGCLWEFMLGAGPTGALALADLNGDGTADAIVGTSNAKLHALSGSDGRSLWTYPMGGLIVAVSVSADLDKDGVPDCIASAGDWRVHAVSGRTGARLWEFKAGGLIYPAERTADLNGDGVPDCVAGSIDCKVYAISGRDGEKLWEVKAGLWFRCAPGLADLNRDGIADVVAGCQDGTVYALSGRDGTELWKFQGAGAPQSTLMRVDLDGDGTLDGLVCTETRVYALSGRGGTLMWEFETGARIVPPPALADLDGDGAWEYAVGGVDSRMRVLSARDGRLLRIFTGATSGSGVRSRVLARSRDWRVSVFEFRAVPAPPVALVQARAWMPAKERANEELKTGRDRRELLHLRGLAKLRLGDARGGVSDFREAARLGLRSPELHGDLIEALLVAGELKAGDVLDSRPETSALLLAPGRLTKEQRTALARVAGGTAPHVLILAGRSEEAIKALEAADPYDIAALSLRALALRESGELSRARTELERAILLRPFNRELRVQMDDLLR